MRTKKNVCNDCGAYVCEQSVKFGSGCVELGTAPPENEFLCLPCDAKKWRRQPEGRKELPVSVPFMPNRTEC